MRASVRAFSHQLENSVEVTRDRWEELLRKRNMGALGGQYLGQKRCSQRQGSPK